MAAFTRLTPAFAPIVTALKTIFISLTPAMSCLYSGIMGTTLAVIVYIALWAALERRREGLGFGLLFFIPACAISIHFGLATGLSFFVAAGAIPLAILAVAVLDGVLQALRSR